MWSTTLLSRSRSWLTTRIVAGIGLEEILEPQRRFEIEMVRRLVEQQQVGLREQQRRERDAHLPAAREAVERPVLRLLVEAEPDQDARGARRRGIGVDRDQPLVDFAEPVGIVAGLGSRASSAARSVSAASTVSNGVALPRRRFLRDIAEARCRAASRSRRRRARAGRPSPSSASTCPRRCGRSARRGCAAAASRSRRRGSCARRGAP